MKIRATLGVLAALTLVACAGQSGPAHDYLAGLDMFAAGDYAGAKAIAQKTLDDLDRRPKDEEPSDSMFNTKVNVHNYTIITLELLGKAKYALGERKDLAAIADREEDLLTEGYTRSYAKVPTAGAKLYTTMFRAASKVDARDYAAADAYLERCKGMQNLPDGGTAEYRWVGDDGTPPFGRYMWSDMKASVLQNQGHGEAAIKLRNSLSDVATRLKLPKSN